MINFSQCPGKMIKGRVVGTEGGAILCGKERDCYKGYHTNRDVTHLIPMGETVLLRWESRFVFIVVWESTGAWIKHLVLLEKASWLEGQLANCSKRVKWHPIRGSVQNRCSLIEKAAGARWWEIRCRFKTPYPQVLRNSGWYPLRITSISQLNM